MARLELFHLARLRALAGDPLITFPYGDLNFRRIERVYRVERSQSERPFLIADGDYTGTSLTEQRIVGGDHIYVEIYQKYDTLPSPHVHSEEIDQATGLPIFIDRQIVLASAPYISGLIVPATLNISAIAVSTDGKTTVVTLTSPIDVQPESWLTVAGTNSTPLLDGPQQLASIISPTQIVIAVNVTGAGTAGTVKGINNFTREMKANGDSVLTRVKIESVVGVADISTYNKTVNCEKEYSFPAFLRSIDCYTDQATTTGFSFTEIGRTKINWNGTVAPDIQQGWRGLCKAVRYLKLTPVAPDNSALASTFVMPSTGRVIVQGGAFSQETSITSGSFSQTTSSSVNFSSHPISDVLTGPAPAVTIHDPSGLAQTIFTLNLSLSVPTHFTAGDTVIVVDQPEMMLGGLFWKQFRWDIKVPYTSGMGPP